MSMLTIGEVARRAAGLIHAIRREPVDTPVNPRDVRRVAKLRFARKS